MPVPDTYQADYQYIIGDAVINGGAGKCYLCLYPCTNDPPPSANWQEVGAGGGGGLTMAQVQILTEG